MDWTREIDAYCERLSPDYWAEPVNAITNLAFLIAAFVMWRRVQGQGLALARWLCGILAAIGIGSFLFHTHAQSWSALADVLPIVLFVLLYIYAANRDMWQMRRGWAICATVAFFPYAALTVPVFSQIAVLGSSAAYAPVPLLILIYAALLWRRMPDTALGLAMGATLLILSILFRSIDLPLCSGWPLGTHFMWHILNALMLGWMIEVYRRHRLRSAAGS